MNRLSYFTGISDTTPVALDVTPDDLIKIFGDPVITDCDPCVSGCKGKETQPLWSPTEYHTPQRLDQNVSCLTAIVYDLDHVSLSALMSMKECLSGTSFLIHSTHSHRPPNDCCVRVILFTDRSIPVDKWSAVWANLASDFKEWGATVDMTCANPSRFYYLPSVSKENAKDFYFATGEGDPINVSALLSAVSGESASHQDVSAGDSADLDIDHPEIESLVTANDSPYLDYDSARKRLVEVRGSLSHRKLESEKYKGELLRRVLEQVALSDFGARDNNINKVVSIIAWSLPVATPWQVIEALIKPSIVKTPLQPNETVTQWIQKAAHCYKRAQQRHQKAITEREAVQRAITDRIRGSVKTEQGHNETPTQPANDDWTNELIKDDKGNLKNCGYNIGLILDNREDLKGSFRWDLLKQRVRVSSGVFQNEPHQTLHIGVSNWLQRNANILCNPREVKDQLARIGFMNAFNPLKEYVKHLQWNGVDHLRGVFLNVFDADPIDSEGNDITEYLITLGYKWFVSAVARALDPGCKVDTMLILESPQGRYKSGIFEKLFTLEFFCDAHLKIGDKDSLLKASRSWCVEMAELSTMKRTDVDSLKQFLTQRNDPIRVPYAPTTDDYPRNFICVGTVNPEEGRPYMTDPTGARRFWPVKVNYPKIQLAEELRDQLWAQAAHIYNTRHETGFEWWFRPDSAEAKEAERHAKDRYQESHYVSTVADWFYGQEPGKRRVHLNAYDLAIEALGLSPIDLDSHRNVLAELSKACISLGFKNIGRQTIRGVKRTVYETTPEQRSAPKQSIKTGLTLTPNRESK